MADLILKKEVSDRFSSASSGPLFLYASLLLFFLTLASYGGLAILNSGQKKALADLNEQIQLKEQELRPELLNQIFLLDTKIRSLRSLLTTHKFLSNVFRLLENDTHSKVRFTSFNLTADGRKLDMGGETANFTTLSQQISLLEKDPQVETVEFGGLSVGAANLLGFKLTLVFKEALLYIRP